jgi:membrane-associated phospholipid phosphatase
MTTLRTTFRLFCIIVSILISSPVIQAQTIFRENGSGSFLSLIRNPMHLGITENHFPEPDVVQEPLPAPTPSVTSAQSLNLFGNLGNNVLDSFRGNNIYLHLSAVAATTLLVTGGIDYDVEHYFNQHPEYGSWAHPVVFSGMYLPFVAGGSLFAYSKINNDKQTLGASFAVLQASLIEFLYNSTLKAITGRPHPDWRNVSDMDSLSKTFRFGFLRGGMFWGWPSGHTAATMAVVSALTNYYPDKTWLKIAGYGLVGYTMFGVCATNRGGMHWFSDAVAGALMSYAVGSTVGKYYRKIYSGQKQASTGASTAFNPMKINISIGF